MPSRTRPTRSPASLSLLQLCLPRNQADRENVTGRMESPRACARWFNARVPRGYCTVSRFPSKRSPARMPARSFSTPSRTGCARSSASPKRFCSRSLIAKRVSGSKSRCGPVAFITSKARPRSSSARYHGCASFIPREMSATNCASHFSRAFRIRRSMPALPSLLETTASRHGARPALSMNARVLTYAELDACANRIANGLIRQGVRIGDRVALWMPKSLEAIASIWGILKAGAAFVPVDPSAPVSRLATIARDCEIRALITAMDHADDLHDEFGASPPMHAVLYSGDSAGPVRGAPRSSHTWRDVEAESAETPPVRIDNDALALVQYTSGSSGAPKGVAISHRALVAQADWTVSAMGLSSNDRIPGYTPLSSAMSTFEVFSAVLAAASVFPVAPRIAPFPAVVAKSWSDQRITVVYVVASVLQLLLSRGNLGALDFSALQTVLIGGEH